MHYLHACVDNEHEWEREEWFVNRRDGLLISGRMLGVSNHKSLLRLDDHRFTMTSRIRYCFSTFVNPPLGSPVSVNAVGDGMSTYTSTRLLKTLVRTLFTPRSQCQDFWGLC